MSFKNKYLGSTGPTYSPNYSAHVPDKQRKTLFMKKRKILVLGSEGVGKTTLINTYVFDDHNKREEQKQL